ncbi:MAG: DUF1330 domain-containing protein [Micropepsaceae bacterium]|mgnify:FL=1
MAKGYWIARIDVHNPEGYKAYIAANAAALKKYGAKFLVRGGRFECPEGGHRARNVVLKFPNYEAAVACWYSPEYQSAIPHRTPFSQGDFLIVEGYDGLQP